MSGPPVSDAPNLDLELLADGQSLAYITHNEAINALDGLVFLAVIDRDLTAPPGGESDGDVYIVGASATGDWSGHDAKVALYYSGWKFITPKEGWIARIKDTNQVLQHNGTAWVVLANESEGEKIITLRVNAPLATDEIPLLYTNVAITIKDVRTVRLGGTSVAWNIDHGSDRSAPAGSVFSSDQVTTSTTTGDVDNSGFSDATIPSGRFVFIDMGTVTGAVTWCEWTITFTEDAI